MAANLSPEYKDAEANYRKAREPAERVEWLREMLRTIPKHKGTEHIQADLKTRIKELTEELAGPRKGAARGGPSYAVRPEGAAQIALLGPPNVGKSSLHATLTGSHAAVGPYPFTTKAPLPGMLPHEDIHLQLLDLPPITADYLEPWMSTAVQSADAALLVLDLGDPDCVDHLETVHRRMADKRVSLIGPLAEAPPAPTEAADHPMADPFRIELPTVVLANKSDALADPGAELAAFLELCRSRFPALAVSARTGAGLDRVGPRLFDLLGVVRAYTKVPGHPAEMGRPFTLRHPATVRDVARLVHRGRAAELRFARLWGSAEFGGQQVSGDHPIRDRDVVELHW
jgi:ribosome-interacting GTPase 1